MAEELEIKLLVNGLSKSEVLARLAELFPGDDLAQSELINIYFDTPELILNQKKVALRVRKKGDQFIQTLKTQGVVENGVHRRGEWEWSIPSASLNSELLERCEAWPAEIAIETLKAVFETNFRRYKLLLDCDNAKIELVFDCGEVLAAGATERLFEIELELLSGDEQALFTLKDRLSARLPLSASDISKAERGYKLFLGSQA